MLYSVDIGKNIVYLRDFREISQEELSFVSDISTSRLRDIEHGCANPTIDTLESISIALCVPLPVLFLLHLSDDDVLEMLYLVRPNVPVLL